MIAFLTSSPGDAFLPGSVHTPCRFREENDFLPCLRDAWPSDAHCLLICAEPDAQRDNDAMSRQLFAPLYMSGLPAAELALCDGRNAEQLPLLLSQSNVVILSGGHTLTQNRFFRKIELRKLMKIFFHGLLLGISGGSMNCAETVYAQPEREDDFSDPHYERFPRGLGATQCMLLPHYQLLNDQVLAGSRLIEDVTIPDSIGQTFYGIPDGSYLLIDRDVETIMGDVYVISDQHVTRRHDLRL